MPLSCYLAGANTRRVRRALSALFAGAIGKDTVGRVWRKVKSSWDTWNARSLAEEPIMRMSAPTPNDPRLITSETMPPSIPTNPATGSVFMRILD
ncbi:hypothetical protein CQ12_39885 [Bradyrhizobium jicamae]|uniref:Transposase n=1 Tax=Bradyrhizobium jicamae TaxID=280332 RepID=A0A0R3LWZ7_9BRAD|nr:transposase [Bradyrhizobium jicamae]KRR10165.1 hypothetical protein CQ12_39885 [Bradyrhizobium jicamae]